MIPGDAHIRSVDISNVFIRFSEGCLNQEFGAWGCLVLNLLILYGFNRFLEQMRDNHGFCELEILDFALVLLRFWSNWKRS